MPNRINIVRRSRKMWKNSFRTKAMNCFITILICFTLILASACALICTLVSRSHGLAGQLLEYIVHRSSPELLFQPLGGIQRTDYAVHHNGDTVAILRLIHKMGGDKDGNAPVGSLVNQFPELAAGSRINTPCRFIQEYDFRLMENGNGKSKFLFPAQRKAFHQRVTLPFQPQTKEQFIRPRSYFRLRNICGK